MDLQLQEIVILARQAGVILKENFSRQHVVNSKGHSDDPVTETDKASEAFILDRLARLAPGDRIITEESGLVEGDSGRCWYIDPLDGTMNYSHSIPYFCVSIALAVNGALHYGVIYDPMRDECFSAEKGKGAFLNGRAIHASAETRLSDAFLATGFSKSMYERGLDNFPVFKHMMLCTAGVRRMGSAALELAYVGCGRLDGMWEMQLQPWDVAAGFLIASEAGAIVTAMDGSPDAFRKPYNFLTAPAALHGPLLAELKAGGTHEA